MQVTRGANSKDATALPMAALSHWNRSCFWKDQLLPDTQLPWQIINPCVSSLLGPPGTKGGPAGCGCAGPCRRGAAAVGPHRVRGSLAHFLAPLPNLHPSSQHNQQLCTPFSTSFSPVFLCAHSLHMCLPLFGHWRISQRLSLDCILNATGRH